MQTVGRRRRRLPAAERRRQLVEAGARAFALEGYHQAGTAGIARFCGIAEPTIYRHFPSKEDLFLIAAREAAARLVEGLREASPRDVDALAGFLGRAAGESPDLALLGRLLAEARRQPFREGAEEALRELEGALSPMGEAAPLARAVVAGAALLAAAGLLVPEERWAAQGAG